MTEVTGSDAPLDPAFLDIQLQFRVTAHHKGARMKAGNSPFSGALPRPISKADIAPPVKLGSPG
jgi:hypothetical protein